MGVGDNEGRVEEEVEASREEEGVGDEGTVEAFEVDVEGVEEDAAGLGVEGSKGVEEEG